jgi:hypothetical protein
MEEVNYETQTLAEFYDKQEEEYKQAALKIQVLRARASELGLLNKPRKEIEQLAQHVMFF